jgi:hypothetical protein
VNSRSEQMAVTPESYQAFATREDAASHRDAVLLVHGMAPPQRRVVWLTCPVSKLKANEVDVDRAADLIAQLSLTGTYWRGLAQDFRSNWTKEYLALPVGIPLPHEPNQSMRPGLWLREGWWEEEFVDLYRLLEDLLCSQTSALQISDEYPEIDTRSMTIAEAHLYPGSYVRIWSGLCHRWVVQAPIGMVHVDHERLLLLASEINRLYLERPSFVPKLEPVPDRVELHINAGKDRRLRHASQSAVLLVSGSTELAPRVHQIAAFLRGERTTLDDRR